MGDFDTKHPYWWRLRLRRHLPWFLIEMGVADKGKDCEAVDAKHHWYNHDDESSGCYYCKVTRPGRLWDDASGPLDTQKQT
jgi:hypothetical protein